MFRASDWETKVKNPNFWDKNVKANPEKTDEAARAPPEQSSKAISDWANVWKHNKMNNKQEAKFGVF